MRACICMMSILQKQSSVLAGHRNNEQADQLLKVQHPGQQPITTTDSKEELCSCECWIS